MLPMGSKLVHSMPDEGDQKTTVPRVQASQPCRHNNISLIRDTSQTRAVDLGAAGDLAVVVGVARSMLLPNPASCLA